VPVGDPIQWLKVNIVAINKEKYRNEEKKILNEKKHNALT